MELEHTEKVLLKAGAKSFEDSHPDIPKFAKQDRYNNSSNGNKEAIYIPTITFRAPDLNEAKEAGYTKMFEAAWKGDLETIKVSALARFSSNSCQKR